MATLPEDGDYVISDSGPLGSLYSVSVVNGPFVGMYKTESRVCHAIRNRMEYENWYPNVFRINDHGNVMQVKLVFKLEGGAS